MKKLFTSESVRKGHPDKLCDQICDAILDDIISKDPKARVAVEASATRGLIDIHGEITTECYSPFEDITRKLIRKTGYKNPDFGLDYRAAGVINSVHMQSPEISAGVDEAGDKKQGAGDQGMMFGYACSETPELMPFPIMKAHALAKAIDDKMLFRDSIIRPDGKTQVTAEYSNGKVSRIEAIVLAVQHDPVIKREELLWFLNENVVNPLLKEWIDKSTKIILNGTGLFTIGGPEADSGAVGRKIMVDTYGGYVQHGGGAFSGKDPSKVDRSGAYYARYAAKSLVAAGISDRIMIQVAYAIGVAEPVSILVDSFRSSKYSPAQIQRIIKNNFDFRPGAIIEELDLLKPRYLATAAYGHFGRNEESFTWEKAKVLK
jgi:S-adenosylmethionine synthetase